MYKNNKKSRFALSAAAAAAIGALLVADNVRINIEKIQVSLKRLPFEFDGFSIAHLSDLHLPNCARKPDKLVDIVEKIKPDIIALTGDLVDRFADFDAEGLSVLASGLAKIAPCYAVIGNHEVKLGVVDEWVKILKNAGITVLGKSPVFIRRGDSDITLYGLPDGDVTGLPELDYEVVNIVLSHYPEKMLHYSEAGFDLVLSGHAHGGQWRLGKHGLISPGEGFFPKYTSGLYHRKNTKMVVSRGLRKGIPVRILNSPHIPVVILKSIGKR
ncbi:MAG TPA: metallophosphoesterase [Clostridiales bacterium]|nr:metallophosphoesterase [Clostridiales bacterium]